MERIPLSPPAISPIESGDDRPIWSVMIPAYNCIKFLPDTLTSVLKECQDREDMQIEVVDDASTDGDVEALVREIGKGKINYFRQEKNMGSLRNFETCLIRSKGRLIHLLHGDDRIRQGFYVKMEHLFKRSPEAGAAFCRVRHIDGNGEPIKDAKQESMEEGLIPNWLVKIATQPRIQYVSIVVKREVYENLGSFYGMTYAEDWEMWARIARHYDFTYSPEILAEYREHSNSISHANIISGQISKDVVKATQLIAEHLPEDKKYLIKKTEKGVALFCLIHANMIWTQTKNKDLVIDLLRLSLTLKHSLRLYYHIVKIHIRMILPCSKKNPRRIPSS